MRERCSGFWLLCCLFAVFFSCTAPRRGPEAGIEDGGGCLEGELLCSGTCVLSASNPQHCGGCDRACPSGPNATAVCSLGRCSLLCADGFRDCNNDASDGCEAFVANDRNHCGACGSVCPSGEAGTAYCREGRCGLTCSGGRGDCDEDSASGCEASFAVSIEHCSGCGSACPWVQNALPVCSSGLCSSRCLERYADCDGVPSTGCEAYLLNANNCGGCGRACVGATRYCGEENGTLQCLSICASDTTDCSFACVRTDRDPEHCGGCGRRCPSGVNSTAECTAGRCSLRCRSGYADCDGNAANGCEVNLQSNSSHCGACGMPCRANANEDVRCAGGRCLRSCRTGYLSCNNDSADGCETNVNTSSEHCGGCGRRCAEGTLCRQGQCVSSVTMRDAGAVNDASSVLIRACEYTQAWNGCPMATNPCGSLCANLQCSLNHCGMCFRQCGMMQECTAGECRCGRGTEQCESTLGPCAGCFCGTGETSCRSSCANLLQDPNHCGACGTVCRATAANAIAVCNNGRCEHRCLPGFTANGGDCVGIPYQQRIAMYARHACFIDNAGVVVCRGANESGQATPPTDLPRARQISVGDTHSCALVEGGTIRCWGGPPSHVQAPGGTGWRAVYSTAAGSCAVAADNTVRCWGNVPTELRLPPQPMLGIWMSSADFSRSYVLLSNGTRMGALLDPTPRVLSVQPQMQIEQRLGCGVALDGTLLCTINMSSGETIRDAVATCNTDSSMCVLRAGNVLQCYRGGLFNVSALTTEPPVALVCGRSAVCVLSASGRMTCTGL